MPRGLRDAGAYGARLPRAGARVPPARHRPLPELRPDGVLAELEPPPLHPVRLVGDADDLRRSRLTVFFRLPLAIPHLVWLLLWAIAAFFAVIVQWFVTLFAGRPARAAAPLPRRATSATASTSSAFLFLAANPFPGFTGAPGRYPLDLELPRPERQNRWKTGFRLVPRRPGR